MPVVPINWLAVVACAVVSMILGTLWYGPLFGKQWMALMGITPEQIAKAKANGMKGMWKNYLAVAVMSVITAVTVQHNLVFGSSYLHMTGVMAGLNVGFWNWLGFNVPLSLNSFVWEKKPAKLCIINSAYYLVQFVIMGIILSVWM